MLLPQRRGARAKLEMQDSIEPGDEIVTAGGLYGVVREVWDDELEVEIAPETVVRIATRAVAGVIPPDEEDDEDAHDQPEHDEPERSPDPAPS